MIIRQCKICNKEFITYPSTIKKGFGIFCSHKCFHLDENACMKGKKQSSKTKIKQSISRKKYLENHNPNGLFQKGMLPWNAGKKLPQLSGKNNPNWKGHIKKICPICNNRFEVYPSTKHIKYCSSKCAGKAKLKRVNKKCLMCGKEFYVIFMRKDKAKYCNRKCFAKASVGKIYPNRLKKGSTNAGSFKSGKLHPQWNNWSSRKPYAEDWSIVLREKIRQRDNYKCQICGVSQMECVAKLSVHHINKIKTDSNNNNLISLCNRCHRLVHNKNMLCPIPNTKVKEITI